MSKLLDADSHFAFGANWKSFLKLLDPERVAEAEAGMARLLPNGELRGATFLDIGCGSGLSSLAALRLGARKIVSIDIDKDSVEATESLRAEAAPGADWTTALRSVFDTSPEVDGQFDVVYSWGVLHHTGDMWRAVEAASRLVKPGGLLVIALYRRTPLCELWKVEKKVYAGSPRWVQAGIRVVYTSARFVLDGVRGRRPWRERRDYKRHRGMDWAHDVHDWLGGYPYESASPEEVRQRLRGLGFEPGAEFLEKPGFGLWGSGCDEFVARRA